MRFNECCSLYRPPTLSPSLPTAAAAARLSNFLVQIYPALERHARYDRLGRLAERYAKLDERGGSPGTPLAGDLTRFEYSVFSQNGEDGVICELLTRTGEGSRSFVEFGIETGSEGNCVFLAEVRGWSGLFMEGDGDDAKALARRWRGRPSVETRRAMVEPESINALLDEAEVPAEPTIFSIDIDGNDYHVWQALERKPRIVIVEYNSALPLDREERLVQPYAKGAQWAGTDFFGASLGALEQLGSEKGYALVHTDLIGVNAFFVRDDLVGSLPTGDLVPRRSVNFSFAGHGHRPDSRGLDSYLRV
jgi:hypothetical protein